MSLDLFANTKQKNLGISQTIQGNLSCQDYLEMLQRNKSRIQSTLGLQDDLVASLLFDADNIPDNFNPTDRNKEFANPIQLDEQNGQDFYDAMVAVLNPDQLDGQTVGSIVDVNGWVYRFIVKEDGIYTRSIQGHGEVDNILYEKNTHMLHPNIWPLGTTASDYRMNIYSLLSDIAQNNTMNSIWCKAAELCLSLKFSIEAMDAYVKTEIQNFTEAVSTMLSDIYSSYNKSGLYGTIKILIQYITGPATIDRKIDGLTFTVTDNQALLPKEYIVGIVSMVIGLLTVVAGAIIAIFSKVLGVAVSTLGALLLAMPQAIAYDYENETNAGVDYRDRYDEAIYRREVPFAVYQTQIEMDYPHPVYTQLPAIINVPGGSVYIGLIKTLPSNRGLYQLEFHPSVDYHDVTVSDYSSYIYYGGVSYVPTGTHIQEGTLYYGKINFKLWNDESMDGEKLCGKIIPIDYPCKQGTNVLTDYGDFLMRAVVMHNIGLFLITLSKIEWSNETVDVFKDFPAFRTNTMSVQNFDFVNDDIVSECYGLACFRYQDLMNIINTHSSYTFGSEGNCTWSDIIQFAISTTGAQWTDDITGPLYLNAVPSVSADPWTDYGSRLGVGSYLLYDYLDAEWGPDVFGEPLNFPAKYAYYYGLPKYNKGTFIFWVMVFALSVVAVAVVAGVATIKGKQYIRRIKAKNSAAVEHAHNKYVSTLDPDDYDAYVSAVSKNNAVAKLLNGTKYSKVGYWQDASSNDTTTFMLSKLQRIAGSENSDDEVSANLTFIKKAIVGA